MIRCDVKVIREVRCDVRPSGFPFLRTATEATYGVGESTQGVPREIGGGLPFEVHAEFPRYRHGEMVCLVDECVYEFRPGGSRADADIWA